MVARSAGVGKGLEVWLADFQMNDIAPLRFQRLRLGQNRIGPFFHQMANPVRKLIQISIQGESPQWLGNPVFGSTEKRIGSSRRLDIGSGHGWIGLADEFNAALIW
jgi:hypothetical protein